MRTLGWVMVMVTLPLVACGGGGGSGNDDTGANGTTSPVTGTSDGSGGSSSTTGASGLTAGGGSSSVTGTTGVDTSGGGSGGNPEVVVAQLPNGGSQTEFAVNLVDAGLVQFLVEFLSQPTDVDPDELDPGDLKSLVGPSHEFYQYFKDEYDFLFFVSPDELDVNVNGLHETVHTRTIPGTGVNAYSPQEYFGSDGTLMSAIGFVFRSAEQRPPFAHEVLHRYAQHLDESLGFGDDFKGGQAAHWGTTSVNGVLGGFDAATLRCKTPAEAMPPDCTPEGSGRIHYVADAFSPLSSSGLSAGKPYAPLELYMMGLVPAEEIPQSYLILEDASPEPVEYDTATQRMVIDASGMSEVTIGDIIAMHGPRPQLPMDQRTFRGALVVLSATPAGDEFMALANSWAASFGGVNETTEWPSFETLTGGRARMNMRIGDARSENEPIVFPERPDPMCNVYAQDCGTGLACYDYEAPICMPEGVGQIGDACERAHDCALGLDCSVGGGTGYSCAPYCDPSDPASPVACDSLCPGAFAEVFDTVYDENGELSFPIIGGVCAGGAGTGGCDPLNQAECGAGNGCFGREATTCQPAGDLALGETCFPLGVVCVAGTECIGIQGADYSYCQPYCDPNGDGPDACATLCPGGAWNYGDYSICIPE